MIALYYFFADGPALLRAGEGLIPVHAIYQRQLLRQFEKVIRAVVLATFLAALGQGLATALALTFVGVQSFFRFFPGGHVGINDPLDWDLVGVGTVRDLARQERASGDRLFF